MPYCVKQDIINLELTEKELIQLTDDSGLGEVGDTMITAAITRADAEIDKFCMSFYTVPFTTVPELVKGWSATLAAFFLFRNRKKPDTLIDRYNKVMHDLKEVSLGNYSIPGGEAASSIGTADSTTLDYQQTFTRSQMGSDGVLKNNGGSMDTW